MNPLPDHRGEGFLFTPQTTVLTNLNPPHHQRECSAPGSSRAHAKHTLPVDFLIPELELRRFEAPSKSFGDNILGYGDPEPKI